VHCRARAHRMHTSTPPLAYLCTGTPGKLSLGSYITLISMVNFGLWLKTVVVSLLIAAQLCWLLLAFMFEAALARGVT
jgi:hypothetical protein